MTAAGCRLLITGFATIAMACGSAGTGPAAPEPADITADRCLVRLHGKGGDGQPTVSRDGVAELTPRGNAEAWGGREWLYFPDSQYAAARDVVSAAIDEVRCQQVVINGFSNGGGFAGKLYCNGETFGDRLIGVVLDDPVPDAGTAGCQPPPEVRVALYWTTAQDSISQPGFECSQVDGTCEGGVTVGIDAYASAIGADVQPSRFTEHEWYRDAPELTAWFASSGP